MWDPKNWIGLEDPDSADTLQTLEAWKAWDFFPLIATDITLVTIRWSEISSVRKEDRGCQDVIAP